MNNLHLSFSSLSLPCPLARLKAVKGTPPEILPHEDAEYGTELHEEFERFLKTGNLAGLTKHLPFPSLPDKWREFKEKWGDGEIEKWFEIELAGYTFKGRIDLYKEEDGIVYLIDFKSKQKEEIIPSWKEQLRLYALPDLQQGKKVVTMVYFIKWGNLHEIETLEGFDDYEYIRDKIVKVIKETVALIEKGEEPKPHASSFCKYCNYPLSCPKMEGKPVITSEEEARKVAEEYVKVEAHYKALQKMLQGWVKRSDKGIEIEDVKIDYHPSTTLKCIDKHKLFDYLLQNGYNPFDIFSPEITKIRKLAKQDENITNFFTEEYTTRWGVKKIRKEE